MKSGKERHETNYLPAINSDFQKVLGPKLAKEQEPHHMKSIFAEAPFLLFEITAMLLQPAGQSRVEIMKAIKVKLSWLLDAVGPAN